MDRHRAAAAVGPVGPLPDGLDAPYWEGLARDELLLQRCGRCRTWIWGPQWACPDCLAVDPVWEPAEARGLVYSWTRTWQPFAPGFADHIPYLSVLVQLPNAGDRRVLGLLLGDVSVDPVIGEAVTGVFCNPADSGGATILAWERS